MLLEVKVNGEPWLADVGFGGVGPFYPMRLIDQEQSQQGAWTFRIQDEGTEFVLRSLEPEGWLDLFSFTREPQHPIDYEPANHWTSTHPHSPFVRNLVVQKGTLNSRLMLENRELIELKPQEQTTELIQSDDDLLHLLANRFGLHFPPETRFRPPSDG
jgi:N-hydroxyarylamine O-acetyltransferase